MSLYNSTICLEFDSKNRDEAGQFIAEVINRIKNHPRALELDLDTWCDYIEEQ